MRHPNEAIRILLTTSLLLLAATGQAAVATVTAIPDVPPQDLRWWDVAANVYDPAYVASYTYAEAAVTLDYGTGGLPRTLAGRLSATGLKPNFSYQMKLEGKPTGLWGTEGDDETNEAIGFLGRWWRVQPSPGNSSDADYLAHRDDPAYIYIGYLLFDFFITDAAGAVEYDFALDSSLHVLANNSQGGPGACDAPLKWRTVVGAAGDPAYVTDVGPTDVGVWGQQEPGRPCAGEAVLPSQAYDCRLVLTEESFHQTGEGSGNWASVLACDQLLFDTAEPATVADAHDFVEIGNPASEAGHALEGWGPVEPETHGGGWGGIAGETPPGSCRTVWSPLETEPDAERATLELDFGVSDSEPKCLRIRYLDGASDDSYDVLLDGAVILSVAAPPSLETWRWTSVDVTGTTGVHTLGFAATAPQGSYFDPYGQVAIDRVHVGTQVNPVPADAAVLACGGSKRVDLRWSADCDDGPIRGYSVRIRCPEDQDVLAFDADDITVHIQPPGLAPEDCLWQVYRAPDAAAANDWTVDYAILGDAALPDGIPSDAVLFSVDVHGNAEGVGSLSVAQAGVGMVAGGAPPAVGGNATTVAVDCTPPPPAAGITAQRGQDKIRLSWTYPGDAEDKLEIWRGIWTLEPPDSSVSAYPEYDDHTAPDDREPTWPLPYSDLAPSGEWHRVRTVAADRDTIVDFPNAPYGLRRGIYSYVIFARDPAGNLSPPPDACARATSYLLGDLPDLAGTLPTDGRIAVNPEVNRLALCYGTADGAPGYDPWCDIGPTHNGSGEGLPLTDSSIGFEDLMIFAMNYDTQVDKTRSGSPPAHVGLAWTQTDASTWSLVLTEPCPDLQGLRLRWSLPAKADAQVAAGELTARQTAPVFLHAGRSSDLDVSLALLGAGFDGDGELLRISLDAPAAMLAPEVTARDTGNRTLDVMLAAATGTEPPPAVTGLEGCRPNPFNPATEILFSLATRTRVELAIYALDGRRVATLLDAPLPAGRHTVRWSGHDDADRPAASGIYFCRLRAGRFRETMKLTLMK